MDNEFSQASLQVPSVPSDFESRAGSSKSDFARAVLELLRGAKITGINVEQPQNFDLAELQHRIDNAEKTIEDTTIKQRTVNMNGIANGLLTVPFEDIGTTEYWVDIAFITTNVNINTVTWSVIEGSKQTTQCQVRIDGNANPYKIEVRISTSGSTAS